jgi:hypothetical protein
MLMRITLGHEPDAYIQDMRSYQENIGRARIVVGLLIAAVFAAVVAQDRNQTVRDDLVLIDGVAVANGE